MATWFDDGDPAEQPVEDPPTVIHVPLLSLGRHSSNSHDGVSSGECGGVPYNPPAGRPGSLDASTGEKPRVDELAEMLAKDGPKVSCRIVGGPAARPRSIVCRGGTPYVFPTCLSFFLFEFLIPFPLSF